MPRIREYGAIQQRDKRIAETIRALAVESMIDSADIVKRTRAAIHRSTMVSKDHALANAAVAIEQQHVELVELKHDINRHIEIAANLATENEKLTYQLVKLQTSANLVASTFEKDEAQGFQSKDRQFAIDILRMALRDEAQHD